jgi:hypothetical protein
MLWLRQAASHYRGTAVLVHNTARCAAGRPCCYITHEMSSSLWSDVTDITRANCKLVTLNVLYCLICYIEVFLISLRFSFGIHKHIRVAAMRFCFMGICHLLFRNLLQETATFCLEIYYGKLPPSV